MGYCPGLFAQKRPISYPREFTRNRHKQSRKELEIHFQACRRRFWEFGAISRTYQNPPCSKALAIAQAFCSKSANFDPCESTRNRYKQYLEELEINWEGSRRLFREFGGISRTYQNPPCSKPWAIAQAFCSKTANIRHSRIHPKSTQAVAHGVRNPFRRV